jgi:hypothetical protein
LPMGIGEIFLKRRAESAVALCHSS